MEQTYKGVVMLNKPPIDKIAAKVILERGQGVVGQIEVSGFWDSTDCSSEQMRAWEAEGILPIDLGDDKYHIRRNQVGSATEFVSKNVVGHQTPAEQELIEMANRNNKTGYLKGTHMSIAWLLRELYELDDEYEPREVISRAGHVIRSWLDATDGVGLAKDRDDTGLSRFGYLLEETAKCNFAPFTPARYLKDLWRLGYMDEEIHERVGWWIEGWKRVKAVQAEAEQELAKLDQTKTKTVAGFRVYCLKTGNKFLTKLVAPKVDITIVRNPSGNVAILTKRLGQAALADELLRLEPGRWYYQETTGALINGGVIYKGVQPTSLEESDFIALLQKFPPRKRADENRPRQMFHGRHR